MMISFRPASMDDAARLFVWRNDPVTRQFSKRIEPIMFADHLIWLAKQLKSDKAMIVVAHDAQRSAYVGMYRVDKDKKRGLVSIAIGAEQRGHGYASVLIQSAIKGSIAAGLDRLVAEIREDNGPSLRAFWSEGFRPTRTAGDGFIVLEKELVQA